MEGEMGQTDGRELCAECRGNGVAKIKHGIKVCPSCNGHCWALRDGEMGQTREGSLKCANCGAANFYECGCYDRCRCGHDRRLHMATWDDGRLERGFLPHGLGTCTVVGCECEHGFHDSAGRPSADTIARLTRERDEARVQVDRLREALERVKAERNRLRYEAALFRVLLLLAALYGLLYLAYLTF